MTGNSSLGLPTYSRRSVRAAIIVGMTETSGAIRRTYYGLMLGNAVAASLIWGINTIFGDFGKAHQMGERGRVKAAYGFSWDVIAGQTEAIYRELL